MSAEDQRMTRVLALRHAETAWNVDARIQGQLDIPLNERGHRQAQRLAQALADEGIAAVYTSDLDRARTTAAYVAGALGLPLRGEPRLRERDFGDFQGHTHEEIAQRWPQSHERWRQRDPEFGPSGGEVLKSFYARCLQALLDIGQRHAGQAVVIVTHGGVLDCLYRAAMGLDLSAPRTWSIGNASVNRLLVRPDGLTMLGWADMRHLEDTSFDEVTDGHTLLSARPSAA